MKRPLLAPIVLGLVLLASYTSSNASLIPFTIMLSGQQETPASPSTAAGGGIALFDDVANTISLSVFFAGLSGTAAQSHIHLAPAGTNGGVIVSFVPFTPQATSGSIVGENLLFPADAATISALLAGDTYFNIHTSAFPGGEIRGQLVPATQPVAAIAPVLSNTLPSLINFPIGLTGSQEVPPNGSTAVGGGVATFDAVANTISLSVFFAGLSGTAAQSHIHLAPAGTNGGVIVSFVPFTPQATSGSIVGENLLFPADAATISALLAGDTYFNIHTSVFPGGEIRGQLLPVVQAVSVPEPPSILLLLAGLIGLMLLSRAFTLPSVDLRLRDPALQSG